MTPITIDRAVVEQALNVAENAGYPLALIKALRDALEKPQTAHSADDLHDAARQALDDLRDLHANHNITCAGTISRLEAALAQEHEDWSRVAARQASRIKQIKTAAQQALDALNLVSDEGASEFPGTIQGAISDLEAALAQEQAEQTWVCPDSPEHRYAKPGHCEDCGRTLVLAQHPGCDHCNHPLYAATKCRVCGRVTERAESVQEPYTDDVTRIMREAGVTFHLGLPHKAVVEQMTRVVDLVYAEASIKAAQQFTAAPPQRKPLTDEEIQELSQQHKFDSRMVKFVRIIERAHGIGDNT